MRLHLGCGNSYLKGYLNIDLPGSRSKVDCQKDIRKLKFPKDSVEEVRLHHVLEHFSRPVVCALVVSWRSWLVPDGLLHIEIPDFERTSQVILSRFSREKTKAVALRHLFGSHEAPWAVHWEGWTQSRLKKLLTLLGFDEIGFKKSSWRKTYNLTVVAQKKPFRLLKPEAKKLVKQFLSQYLLDQSKNEMKLLRTWLTLYDQQLKQTYAGKT